MEYHSDGSLGENTVLLSLFDIDPNQGGLKVFPGKIKEPTNRLTIHYSLVIFNR